MSATRLSLLTAACASLLAPASACWAQAYGAAHVVEHNDLNWFEPVELDLDGRIEAEEGFFFHYDKLYWNASGERVTVGQPGLTTTSETIYPEGASDAALQARVNELTVAGIAPSLIEAILNITFQVDGAGNIITIPTQIPDPNGNDGNGISFITIDAPQVDPTESGNPVQPYQVQNGIQDATPDAEFAWGERYEFGYSDGERGWMIGVLDGPEVQSDGFYGAGNTPYDSQTDGNGPGPDPAYEDDTIDGNGDGVLDGDGPTFPDVHALGFGSVAVNFNLPDPDFLTGFRDYFNNNAGAAAGTVYGPVYYVGNYGAAQEDDATDTIQGARADDINGNGIAGQIFILADLNGDGTVDDDEIVGVVTDFGDLHRFNVFFDTVVVRNRTEMDGVELMATHELSTRHKLEQGRRDRLQLSYGVRFLRLSDVWGVTGLGSILGRTSVTADVDNQLIGPQLGLKYTRDRGAWDLSAEARVMFAYNRADIDQTGIFGEEAIPGALNRSATARTTASVYGQTQDDFSPLGELRLDARYKFSKAVALTLGYTAQYIDNIQRASQTVLWNAPDFGVKDGKRDILVNGVNFGVELRY
jgi:hypothetical protein